MTIDRLTPRERQILELIGRHQFSSKEAALRIGIGPKRVDELCASAVRKLGVASRREAVRLVLTDNGELGGSSPREKPGPEATRVSEALEIEPSSPVYERRNDAGSGADTSSKDTRSGEAGEDVEDELVPTLTWADLEREWQATASPANRHLIQDVVTALWKQSGWLPETHTLSCILTATVLLAGPDCILGSREGPASPS